MILPDFLCLFNFPDNCGGGMFVPFTVVLPLGTLSTLLGFLPLFKHCLNSGIGWCDARVIGIEGKVG